MIIALDIDGTIRDFIGSLNWYYDKDYPDHIRVPVVKSWDLGRYYPLGYEIYDYAFKKHGYDIMKNALPYDDARWFCKQLYSVDNEKILTDHLILATSQRNADCKKATIEWLAYYSIEYADIYFSSRKELLNADILIDDYHVNLNKWAETGRKAICIQRPWNQDIKDWHKNVGFASCYEAILDIVKHYNKHPEELHE